MNKNTCCASLANLAKSIECGTSKPKSSFKVWTDSNGRISVINQKGYDVTEYFNVSIVDGIVIMNYKKDPSLEEWRRIVGKG